MLEDFIESEDGAVQWGDDILHSLDLEYHNVNPETSLYYGLEQAGMMKRVTTDRRIFEATTMPPATTRAKGRGIVIDKLLSSGRLHLASQNVDSQLHLRLLPCFAPAKYPCRNYFAVFLF